jgi:hypothetical protein
MTVFINNKPLPIELVTKNKISSLNLNEFKPFNGNINKLPIKEEKIIMFITGEYTPSNYFNNALKVDGKGNFYQENYFIIFKKIQIFKRLNEYKLNFLQTPYKMGGHQLKNNNKE